MQSKGKNINNEIINAYFHCRYRSYLQFHGENGLKTNYSKLKDRLDREFREYAKAMIQSLYRKDDMLHIPIVTSAELKLGKKIIVDAVIEVDGLQCHFDALELYEGKHAHGTIEYQPVLFLRTEKIKKLHKQILTFGGIVLERLQGALPIYGRIIYGSQCSSKKVRLENHLSSVNEAIADITTIITKTKSISPLLNNHCSVCEFIKFCEKMARDNDNLSLLRGMSEKEIRKHNKRGIFTVYQLSHTFRPKRTPKRTKIAAKPHYFALQALALRKKTLYIHGTPDIPTAETYVYMDIEGLPDRDIYYLIGVLVTGRGSTKYSYFWSDSHDDQPTALSECMEYLGPLRKPKLFHYGNYDRAVIKQSRRILPDFIPRSGRYSSKYIC